jgi:hypothetical protein
MPTGHSSSERAWGGDADDSPSAKRRRVGIPLGLSRPDVGLVFFTTFYLFILVGWYPELQTTYVRAEHGFDVALGAGVIACIAGAAIGSGALADALLAAAFAALGSVAGFSLGAALVGELADLRPFYSSPLDSAALETVVWREYVPAVVGPAVGALAGALAATLQQPRTAIGGARMTAVGLIVLVVAGLSAAGLGAASIGLLGSRVSAGARAPAIDPFMIRLAVLVVSCAAAGSAALVRRSEDGRLATTVPRLLGSLALVAVPYLVATVYRMFVLEPF